MLFTPHALVSSFRENFLMERWGQVVDDFDAPLPVYRNGNLYLLKSPLDVLKVLHNLRVRGQTMGMDDMAGTVESATMDDSGALRLSVLWSFLGLPQDGERVLPVTYWINSRLGRPCIQMVEIRDEDAGGSNKPRMPVRLTSGFTLH